MLGNIETACGLLNGLIDKEVAVNNMVGVVIDSFLGGFSRVQLRKSEPRSATALFVDTLSDTFPTQIVPLNFNSLRHGQSTYTHNSQSHSHQSAVSSQIKQSCAE